MLRLDIKLRINKINNFHYNQLLKTTKEVLIIFSNQKNLKYSLYQKNNLKTF